MAEKHLIETIIKRFQTMPASQRRAKIRKLVNQSAADKKFIQKMFPELYREAFPTVASSAGEHWESNQPHALAARRS